MNCSYKQESKAHSYSFYRRLGMEQNNKLYIATKQQRPNDKCTKCFFFTSIFIYLTAILFWCCIIKYFAYCINALCCNWLSQAYKLPVFQKRTDKKNGMIDKKCSSTRWKKDEIWLRFWFCKKKKKEILLRFIETRQQQLRRI